MTFQERKNEMIKAYETMIKCNKKVTASMEETLENIKDADSHIQLIAFNVLSQVDLARIKRDLENEVEI